MAQPPKATILDYFADLDDPRVERTRHHKMVDILAIAICATICGADSWVHIELFGKSKREWFQSFLELPHGIPSHDTFGTVFARLDPMQLQNCFVSWTQAIAELCLARWWLLTARRPDGPMTVLGRRGPFTWSAPGPPSRACPVPRHGVKTDEKSNEITAIPQLLEMLELNGGIVTIDAMGCQREIAQQITEGGADYVLAVKENQRQLHEGIRDLFEGAETLGFDGVPYDCTETVDKGHGRVEHRECWVITDQDCLDYLDPQGIWPQLKATVRVVGHRQTAEGGVSQPRYYISSLAGSAEQLLAAIRGHWSIENSLHWTLDVTFREDQCRVRKDHGPQNMNILRQIGHNLLKNEPTLKVGIQGKRLNAGWDENYLLKVFLG
ncbi:MAG: ISAs1 family transposase [Chloroflexota bacterium]|nr:ISAs1 family transposase [Chloroflexota bacterium]MDE2683919.1 ISAs1 family transposase [Chloroflexota bacterium]